MVAKFLRLRVCAQREKDVEAKKSSKIQLTRLGWVWFAGLFVSLGLTIILGLFDDTTELTTPHNNGFNLLGLVGITVAIASLIIGYTQSTGTMPRRLLFMMVLGVIGLVNSSTLLISVADLIQAHADFPPSKTHTYSALLTISRAYRTSRHASVQTTPLWSDLNITRRDYDFMLAHRSPDDHGSNPDEISSKGHFCAKATLQRSGDAIRILHAGQHTLPTGTVVICSQR